MNLIYVTPGYLDMLGVRQTRGRGLSVTDSSASPRVVVVSHAFVRRYLGRDDVLGVRLTFAGNEWEIVGVVSDVAQRPGFGNFGPVAAMPSLM